MSAMDTGEFTRPSTTPPRETQPHAGGEARPASNAGRGFSITGIILGVVAVFIFPFIVGPVGLLMGYLGHNRGDSLGRTAMIVAAVGTAIGLAFMVWAWSLLFG